tara:strand:- start:286 stop:531 length:246 start_codon:yes stop_codon:yes gene_type:complete
VFILFPLHNNTIVDWLCRAGVLPMVSAIALICAGRAGPGGRAAGATAMESADDLILKTFLFNPAQRRSNAERRYRCFLPAT